METTKKVSHSPGPWEIRYMSGTDMEILAPHYGSVCKFSGLSDSVEKMDEYGDTEVANAKLVAAAPEMLEALRLALLELRGAYSLTEWTSARVQQMAKDNLTEIENAIRKATE